MISEKSPGGITDTDADSFEQILALYTGDYLETDDFPWAVRRRLDIREKYIGLMAALAEYYRTKGQYQKIIGGMQKAMQYEPLNPELNYSNYYD